jgi:hypothetical protein
MNNAFHQLLQRSEGRGARSTVMTPLGWLIALLLSGLAIALHLGAAEWVVRWIMMMVVGSVFVYVAGYIYFGFTNSDALRSEKFSLSKMALERSAKGDDVFGLVDAATAAELEPPSVNASTPRLIAGMDTNPRISAGEDDRA